MLKHLSDAIKSLFHARHEMKLPAGSPYDGPDDERGDAMGGAGVPAPLRTPPLVMAGGNAKPFPPSTSNYE